LTTPVNPSLANLLFLIKYIERWGTGTNDLIKWCREEGLPEPIFKEVTDNNISPGQANKDLSNLLEKRLIRKQGRGRAIS
jgi:ATP-dependent DNA helicase RecG